MCDISKTKIVFHEHPSVSACQTVVRDSVIGCVKAGPKYIHRSTPMSMKGSDGSVDEN